MQSDCSWLIKVVYASGKKGKKEIDSGKVQLGYVYKYTKISYCNQLLLLENGSRTSATHRITKTCLT